MFIGVADGRTIAPFDSRYANLRRRVARALVRIRARKSARARTYDTIAKSNVSLAPSLLHPSRSILLSSLSLSHALSARLRLCVAWSSVFDIRPCWRKGNSLLRRTESHLSPLVSRRNASDNGAEFISGSIIKKFLRDIVCPILYTASRANSRRRSSGVFDESSETNETSLRLSRH